MNFNKIVNLILENNDTIKVGLYPGSFTPPHIGHFNVAKQMSEDGNDYNIIFTSGRERQGAGGKISETIWRDYYFPLLKNMKLIFSSISPVKDLADLILLTAGNDKKAKNPDIYIQQLSEKLKGNNVIFTVYAGSDRVSDYVKNLGKLRAKNIDIEVSETIRPIVDLGNQDMPIVTKTGKTIHISGPVELSGTIVRNLINMFPSDHIIMKKIFPPEVFYNNGDFEHIIDMLKQRN